MTIKERHYEYKLCENILIFIADLMSAHFIIIYFSLRSYIFSL